MAYEAMFATATQTSGLDPSPAWPRRDEGDDERGPPVSGSERRGASWATLGRKMKQAAGLRERQRLGDGAQGAQPDFDRWATQGNRKGEEKEKKKVFHFLKKK
jgi:hypothetical protein